MCLVMVNGQYLRTALVNEDDCRMKHDTRCRLDGSACAVATLSVFSNECGMESFLVCLSAIFYTNNLSGQQVHIINIMKMRVEILLEIFDVVFNAIHKLFSC